MKIKPGVSVRKMQGPMVWAWLVMEQVFLAHDCICVLTSGDDSKHGEGSKHYEGLAGDFRTRMMNEATINTVAVEARVVLGPDYDVVVESDHIHVEYDPKETK